MADEFGAQKAFLRWEESSEILPINANHGVARAQRLLAIRYRHGRGVTKDEVLSFHWMQLAAQQHFSMAQRSLGDLYENGFGIALDTAKQVVTKKAVNPCNKEPPHDLQGNPAR